MTRPTKNSFFKTLNKLLELISPIAAERVIVVELCDPALPADPEIIGISPTINPVEIDKCKLATTFDDISVNFWIINCDIVDEIIKIISQKILDLTTLKIEFLI